MLYKFKYINTKYIRKAREFRCEGQMYPIKMVIMKVLEMHPGMPQREPYGGFPEGRGA